MNKTNSANSYTFNLFNSRAKKIHSFNLAPFNYAIQRACQDAEVFMAKYGKGREPYNID